MNYYPEYSIGVTYYPGTRIFYSNAYYICKKIAINIAPDSIVSLPTTPTTYYNIGEEYWERSFSFFEVLQEFSPKFLFEDLPNYRIENIQNFYEQFGYFLDSLYLKIKNLNNQLSIDNNEGPYLYELGYLIGVDKLVDLEKYLNSDGSINTNLISEVTFNNTIQNQKMLLKSAIAFYLQKGTLKAFQTVFSGYGGLINIKELWESGSSEVFDIEDKVAAGTWNQQINYDNGGVVTVSTGPEVYPMSGPVFDPIVYSGNTELTKNIVNNSLFTKYSSLLFNYSGGEYEYTWYDLKTDVATNGYPDISAGFEIQDYRSNEKNYFYLLANDGRLLYKTNDDSLSTVDLSGNKLVGDNTWNLFRSDVIKIGLSDDFILMTLSGDNLEIYNSSLELYAYEASGSIFYDMVGENRITNNNCYFIQPFDDLNRIILDRGNYLELRKLKTPVILNGETTYVSDFSLLNTFTKLPEISGATAEYAVDINDNDVLVLYDTGYGNVISNINNLATIADGLYTPNNLFYGLGTFDIKGVYYKSHNKVIALVNCSGDYYSSEITFSDTYSSNSNVILLDTGRTIMNNVNFYEKVISLMTPGNGISIYDISNGGFMYAFLPTITGGDYYPNQGNSDAWLTNDGTFTNIFFSDIINMYNSNDTGNDWIYKILAFNVGVTNLYKTHYFDAKVLRKKELLTFLPNDSDIITLINTLKPIHTELRNIIYYDDLGTFGHGSYGLGVFGRGQDGLTEEDLANFYS